MIETKRKVCECGNTTWEVLKRKDEIGEWDRCSECYGTENYSFEYLENE